MKRLRIIVYGRVQRVGYRDAVAEVARKLGIKGTVRNLEDEISVEIIAEDEDKKLKEFVKLIDITNYSIEVEKLDVHEEKATGEFRYFKILRGDGFQEIGERLDTAGRLLYVSLGKQDKMLEKQDKMLEKQDKMLEKQDKMLEKQDQTRTDLNDGFNRLENKIDLFSNSTQKRFDVMENKYGKVSDSLDKIAGDLHTLVEILKEFKSK